MTPHITEYREIPLSNGQVTLVDLIDYEWLLKWPWHAWWSTHTRSFYAVRNTTAAEGPQRYSGVRMHREILGLKYGDPRQGDHIEPAQTLDNRRSNLRIATRSDQQHNTRLQQNNTSGFKGVSWNKNARKWVAQITINGQNKYLGLFYSPEAAYAAYCAAALLYFGEFARLA